MRSICSSGYRLDLLWLVNKNSANQFPVFVNLVIFPTELIQTFSTDSMYTERFLGLPTEKDNKAGYTASSLVKKSGKLAGKKYLLVHGTLDDNVHYQQSMMLARSLELHDILFKQQVKKQTNRNTGTRQN